MRYLQLAALTLICTVVMSMCLMVDRTPTNRRWDSPFLQQNPGTLPPALEQQLRKFRALEGPSAPQSPPSTPEPAVPRDLPPALEQLRRLELGARNMILY